MQILGPSPPRLPIGYSDYVQLRQADLTYVDKTGFIAQVLGTPAPAQLYPRPRRFGKTLNLTTLRHFLERGAPDLTELYADTEIWNADGGAWRAHFQRHPVIYLTFKDVKLTTWPQVWGQIRAIIRHEVQRLADRYRLDDHLAPGAKACLTALLETEASSLELGSALQRLSGWCFEVTGETVAILIDEYDAALLTAWQHGFWDEAVGFFRTFLGAGLKDNPHLLRGVLIGILRVAKEGARGSGGRPPAQGLSGLNNVQTYGILHPGAAATCFGFTEPEVAALAHAVGLTERLPDIARWYNGYRFGGPEPHTIYNPWSLLQFLAQPAAGLLPYWKNSSANDLIHDLLIRHADTAGPQIERLLAGETVQAMVEENVALGALKDDAVAVWSLLLFSGYLTAEAVTADQEVVVCTLRLPNREVASVYRHAFVAPLRRGGGAYGVPGLASALLAGDATQFGRVLGDVLKTTLSFHDFGRRPVEAVYHAFVIGLLVHLEGTHRVRSNRESGYGRADVLITPRAPGPGAVLELKVIDTDEDETTAQALATAAQQIRDRQYHTEVRAAGATVVHQYAVVFDGKRCWVEVVPESLSG